MNLILLQRSDLLDDQTARITDPRRLKHLHEVHRAQLGDELTLGLIDGNIGRGRLTNLDHHQACFALGPMDQAPPSALDIELILALPRPRMLARSLEHVTALGVKQITLLHSRRVEKSYWQSPELAPEKIRQHLLLGLEQARDTRIPRVTLEARFKPFLEDRLPARLKSREGLLAHPGMDSPCPQGLTSPALLVVGPEGGFVPYEVEQLLAAGCRGIHLGERVLRVETAVVALLSRLSPF